MGDDGCIVCGGPVRTLTEGRGVTYWESRLCLGCDEDESNCGCETVVVS